MTSQLASTLPSFTSTSSNRVAARSKDPRSRSARSRRIRAELYTGTTTDTLTGLFTRIFSVPPSSRERLSYPRRRVVSKTYRVGLYAVHRPWHEDRSLCAHGLVLRESDARIGPSG